MLRDTTKTLLAIASIFLIILKAEPCIAQGGGTKSLFQAGVGARALALGGAYVAYADGPTAVYWNSGQLDFLEKRSATFYYSSHGFGTTSNFIGLVLPTTDLGTIGVGYISFGTDDVEEYDGGGNLGAVRDFVQSQFLFSYGKQIRESLGIGFTVKLERISLAGNSDSGPGVDLGVIYRPDFDSALLQAVAVGVNIQNALRPKNRLGAISEASPRNLKLGVSKHFAIGQEMSGIRFLFDLNKSEHASATAHFGSEYSFKDQGSLRMGVNGGQISFGVGARYRNNYFDYNFGKLFDSADFSGHRVSVRIEFGKGKTERIRIAQEQRAQDLAIQVNDRLWFEEEATFSDKMQEGRLNYYDEEYLPALVDFSNAVDAAKQLVQIVTRSQLDNGSDPEWDMRYDIAQQSWREAESMMNFANAKYDSVEEILKKTIILQETSDRREEDLQGFILEHKDKAKQFVEDGNIERAINHWGFIVTEIDNTTLEDLPDWLVETRDEVIQNIRAAEKTRESSVQAIMNTADVYERQGNYLGAVRELNKIPRSQLSPSGRTQLTRRIRGLELEDDYNRSFNNGIRAYRNKQWQQAAQQFDRALKAKPGDADAKQYNEDARARALATRKPIPNNVAAKYREGIFLYRARQYSEALKLFEEVNKEEPFNKLVLQQIDNCREKLRK